MVFYFVGLNGVMASNFGPALDSKSCPNGYSKVEITASNLAKFNSVAPPNIKYVYTQLQGSTALRNNVNLVLKNSGGTVIEVEFWLADDRTGFANRGIFMEYKENGTSYVWPAADNRETAANSKQFTGWVMFGEHQLATDQSQRQGGMKSVDEVVLHETSHTQWTDYWSKWGGVNGHAYTYGADGMHYLSLSEMLGEQEAALNEGLATSYGYMMNDEGLKSLMSEFSSTGYRYFVEGRSVLAGSSDLYKVKNRISTTLADVTKSPQKYESGAPIVIYTYKWMDVPGWYLLFAEITSAAFFSIIRNQTYQNKDLVLDMIGYTSNAMSPDRKKRFLTYACNRLGLRMENYNNSATAQSDASRISALFPFALLDLLTHFGMTDAEFREDYQKNNADKDPKAYGEYFSRRAEIKTLVLADITANPIKFSEALDKIINYCRRPANMF